MASTISGNSAAHIEPAPLSARHILTTNDFDEFEAQIESVVSVANRHEHYRRGITTGRISALSSDKVGIVRMSYSEPVAVAGTAQRGTIGVVVPLGRLDVEYGRDHWAGLDPFLLPVEGAAIVQPTPLRGGLCISVNADRFLEYVSRLGVTHSLKNAIAGEAGAALRLSAPAAVRGALLEVCRIVDNEWRDNLSSPAVEAAVFSALFLGLLPRLELGSEHLPSMRYAQEAREWIDGHLSETLSMERIAKAVNLSARHLHAVFVREFDMTPMQHVRAQRLAQVRGHLLNSGATDSLTVGSVLARAGVGHRSRFAASYAQRYGESPSETLVRSQK